MKKKYIVVKRLGHNPYYRIVKTGLTQKQAQNIANKNLDYQYAEQPKKAKLRKMS